MATKHCPDCGGNLQDGSKKCACGWSANKYKDGSHCDPRPWHIVEMPWREIEIQRRIREQGLERKPGEDRREWTTRLMQVARANVKLIGKGGIR